MDNTELYFLEEISDFFELAQYAKEMNLCTKPWCTTCGCLQYRSLIRDTIGAEKIKKMVLTIKESQLNEHDIYEWIDPFIVATHEFGPSLFVGSVLLTKSNELQESLRKKREARYKTAELIHQANLDRKQEKKEKRQQRNIEKALEREVLLSSFDSMNLNQKLRTISMDEKHLPHYYPFDFSEVNYQELLLLPENTLEMVIESFSKYKKWQWVDFTQKVSKALQEKKKI